MELRYAHLGRRHTPMREAQRVETARHIAEIEVEQERKNAELSDLTGQPTLQIAECYQAGRRRKQR